MLKLVFLASGLVLCAADLRMASQPKNKWKVQQRNTVKFVESTALYMEPSAFNYADLSNQRQNAYDNFLRSNIDNEQDRRNFNNEPGKDMLPFRSFEGAFTDTAPDTDVKNTIGSDKTDFPSGSITVTPGTPYLVPLRWNNPHSSELEVNIWIGNKADPTKPFVVPIKKPTCSGEGHQDNVISFTVPTDFNSLGSQIPNFAGCKMVGDCVLQIYAHSVESRQYAMGTPLIVNGNVPAATATSTANIPAPPNDVDTTVSQLTHDVCLPSNDPSADITTSTARWARLMSDVFNHAYQNSDFSPYSGQQPDAISRNLQYSAMLKMATGNRGELGRALLKQQNSKAASDLKNLEDKGKNYIVQLEGMTNRIIAAIGNNMKTGGTTTVGANASNQQGTTAQATASCFRCAEVGSTTTTRLQTNTYIPSFVIPQAQLSTVLNDAKFKAMPQAYQALVDPNTGLLAIYRTAWDLLGSSLTAFATKYPDVYVPKYLRPMMKTKNTTMDDATMFKKRNAAGNTDNGVYAAGLAQAKIKANNAPQTGADVVSDTDDTDDALSPTVPTACDDTTTCVMIPEEDMDALLSDSPNCDDDSTLDSMGNPTTDATGKPATGAACAKGSPLFSEPAPLPDSTPSSAFNVAASWSMIILGAVVAVFLH